MVDGPTIYDNFDGKIINDDDDDDYEEEREGGRGMRRKEDRVEGSCSSVSCHDFHLDVKVTECYACRKNI